MKETAYKENLLIKIEKLEARLAEAEDLIDAIKAGEVDAFAVSTGSKAEVFTLESGDYAYRVLIEKFSEGALNLTEDGLIVYTNEYFSKLTNVPYEKIVGTQISDLIDPKSLDEFNSLFTQAIRGNSKGEIDFLIDGRTIPVYISLTSLQPKLATVGMIVTDLTEKKQHEEVVLKYQHDLEEKNFQLFERTRFVETLINSSIDIILVVDKDLRFLTLNKKAESVFRNYSTENLLGKIITEACCWLSDDDVRNDILKALRGEAVVSHELSDPDTGNFFENNYIPLINPQDEIYAVMLISHDITESKKQLEDLRKLSKSDKLKTDFIKMASHELNTPVTSIKGYTQILLAMLKQSEGKEALSPEFVTTSLTKIDKQVLKLVRLISELLDLSRIEDGQLKLRKARFSINELLAEVVEDIRVTNPGHKINLYENKVTTVEADRDRISQVLSNLILNAIKYSPRSESIDIRVDHASENKLAISVKDFGIGIDKNDYQRIFERFYRSEKNNEETYPGFGIGLFISKEIMQKHSGDILVQSEKGKGSTFTVMLPIS